MPDIAQPLVARLARLRRPPKSVHLQANYDLKNVDWPRHGVRLFYSFEGTLKSVAAEMNEVFIDLQTAGIVVLSFDEWAWLPLDRPPRLRTKWKAHGYVRVEPTLDVQENEADWKRAFAAMRERLNHHTEESQS